jgi:prepilin-type N-terminal cleavage/methylation domain-containing protein
LHLSVTLRGPSLSARRGFTLVEVLVGATLSAAVMAAVFSSYIYLGRSLARLANQQILETEGRRALGSFVQDVQQAIDIDTTSTLSASTVTLKIPAATGVSTSVTYTFTNDAGNSGTLARKLATDPAVVLLRNIVNNGLIIHYYDSSGNEYTSYTDYLPGIKQLSLQFSTQLGDSINGTQTLVYQVTSNRVILRNRGLLP